MLPVVRNKLVILEAELVEHLFLLVQLVDEALDLLLLPPYDGCLLMQLNRLSLDTVMLKFVLPQVVVLALHARLEKHLATFFVSLEVLTFH